MDGECARGKIHSNRSANWKSMFYTGCFTCDSNHKDYDYISRVPFTFAHKTEDEER